MVSFELVFDEEGISFAYGDVERFLLDFVREKGKITLADFANNFADTEFSVALCRVGGQVSQVGQPGKLHSFFSTGLLYTVKLKTSKQVHRIYRGM